MTRPVMETPSSPETGPPTNPERFNAYLGFGYDKTTIQASKSSKVSTIGGFARKSMSSFRSPVCLRHAT